MNLFEITQSTSKYKGVSWNEKRNLWQTKFDINGKVKNFYFENKVDAVEKLNELCDKIKISPQNPTIHELPNQQVTNIQITSSLVKFLRFVY